MGAFRSHDGKAPIFVCVGPGRWKFFLLSLCRAVFYQLKHLVFAVHAKLLIDVRRMRLGGSEGDTRGLGDEGTRVALGKHGENLMLAGR